MCVFIFQFGINNTDDRDDQATNSISENVYPYVADRRASTAEYLYGLVHKSNENAARSKPQRIYALVFQNTFKKQGRNGTQSGKFGKMSHFSDRKATHRSHTVSRAEDRSQKLSDRRA